MRKQDSWLHNLVYVEMRQDQPGDRRCTGEGGPVDPERKQGDRENEEQVEGKSSGKPAHGIDQSKPPRAIAVAFVKAGLPR